jgi:hypothetical protein
MKRIFVFVTFAFVLSLSGVFGLGLGERRDYRSHPQQTRQYDQRRDQQWGQQQSSQRQQQHYRQQRRPQDQQIIKQGNR